MLDATVKELAGRMIAARCDKGLVPLKEDVRSIKREAAQRNMLRSGMTLGQIQKRLTEEVQRRGEDAWKIYENILRQEPVGVESSRDLKDAVREILEKTVDEFLPILKREKEIIGVGGASPDRILQEAVKSTMRGIEPEIDVFFRRRSRRPIAEAVDIVANALAAVGDQYVDGAGLQETTGLESDEINDAVAILVENGLADWYRSKTTKPFAFAGVQITARGKYETREKLRSQVGGGDVPSADVGRPPVPIGSPYGFENRDWEIVAERKADTSTLYVTLGYQFESDHYDSDRLRLSIEHMFQETVNEFNTTAQDVRLAFIPLAAGYGEHLFNEIARNIIGADISVFDTSDLNPNVMIEVGVALTWGVKVLVIREAESGEPPTDISGQTYADYADSGSEFVDPQHRRKLYGMVERAVQKKGP